jgi:hypothetical protein
MKIIATYMTLNYLQVTITAEVIRREEMPSQREEKQEQKVRKAKRQGDYWGCCSPILNNN